MLLSLGDRRPSAATSTAQQAAAEAGGKWDCGSAHGRDAGRRGGKQIRETPRWAKRGGGLGGASSQRGWNGSQRTELGTAAAGGAAELGGDAGGAGSQRGRSGMTVQAAAATRRGAQDCSWARRVPIRASAMEGVRETGGRRGDEQGRVP